MWQKIDIFGVWSGWTALGCIGTNNKKLKKNKLANIYLHTTPGQFKKILNTSL